jgi:uncharacterized protein
MIEFDEEKRRVTLEMRGLDFKDALEVLDGLMFQQRSAQSDIKEERFISIGFLRGKHVVIVWTPRGENKRIISMRRPYQENCP